jgi:hypothetical protein
VFLFCAMQRGDGGATRGSGDARLALVASAVLFVLAAWPVALVDVPPLQDLPNHLATATVLAHPERYTELAFNGWFKTNSALFAWLAVVGHAVGLRWAARGFVLLVLALGALAAPRFVLAFGGRRRMVVASFLAWPTVHDWFVSMGMLDFALAVPLAMWMLVLLDAQRRSASVARGVGIALLGVVTWYAHVFPVAVVALLAGVHVAGRRAWSERFAQGRALLVPLVPAVTLAGLSVAAHAGEPRGAMAGGVTLDRWPAPWELVYNVWAEWFHGFTWLEGATIVPCVALGVVAVRRWRDPVPFFGPAALLLLAGLYAASPYIVTDWFHVGSRFLPFLWMAAIARVPERLPRPALAGLAACALSYTIGMGVDYVRLDREWSRVRAGESAVPRGANLLPLMFRSKAVSDNTSSLKHAWGFYVVDDLTSAPLLFAHSRSFPVMYRDPPPPQLADLVLERFAGDMASPAWLCGTLLAGGVAIDDCTAEWRDRWRAFWRVAEPRFTHVLLWDAPSDVMKLVPPSYRVVFQRDELTIVAK